MSTWPMRVVRITSVVHAARFRPGDRQRVQTACGRWWWTRDIEEVDLDVSCEACDTKVRADERETP